MIQSLAILLLSAFLIPQDAAQSLRVRHDHDPWGQCRGDLLISNQGIEYRPDKKEEHHRQWSWDQIQSFDRKSPDQFSLLTYEDLKWKLGKDRFFDFKVLPDSESLSQEAFSVIVERLAKPLTDRLARDIEPELEVPAKHLHTFGGCQGVLKIGPGWIVYDTDHPGHARSWRRSMEVESLWSADPFHLEVHVFESYQRSYRTTRNYRFQLKRRLDADYYATLRRGMVPDWQSQEED
ncbi:MAG TPA: hypothetical protein VLV83_17750 [Acidobacteriota bacterium]|nr:hypothetical protein [Acidobacteriota bacterium]